jgi:hypothetical protein
MPWNHGKKLEADMVVQVTIYGCLHCLRMVIKKCETHKGFRALPFSVITLEPLKRYTFYNEDTMALSQEVRKRWASRYFSTMHIVSSNIFCVTVSQSLVYTRQCATSTVA